MSGFFSDLLFQPHHCATATIKLEWVRRSTVDRRAGLSPEEFRRVYEEPNKPVVLTDAAARCACISVCLSGACARVSCLLNRVCVSVCLA